jgi:hypothetical protein
MFTFMLWAAIFAIVAVGLPTALVAFTGHKVSTFISGATAFVLFLINWWWSWAFLPLVPISAIWFAQNWFWIGLELVVASIIVILFADIDGGSFPTLATTIMSAIVVVMVAIGLLGQITWDGATAKRLVDTVQLTDAQTGEYPETDANHMVIVPVEVARQSARATLGNQGNTATLYEASEPSLQVIAGHAYWVSIVEPKGFFENSRVGGLGHGFVLVDAENPNTPAQYMHENPDKTPMIIKYMKQGWFDNKLARYVYSQGYNTQPATDWTLEIDDNFRPYWTASVDTLPTGVFTTTLPQKSIVVDAQTGDISLYDLDQTPQWVDRIYSSDAVEAMMGWWGRWSQRNFSLIYTNQGDAYKVSEGQKPTLVYTKSGRPEWQLEMSSYSNDKSAMGVVLFDGRSSNAKLYHVNNLLLEDSAAQIVMNSAANLKKNKPSHIALHKIYGKLTWVMPLIDPEEEDAEKDYSAFQGLALMPAESANGSGLVVDANPATALAMYRDAVYRESGLKPGEDSSAKSYEGVVAKVNQVVENGQTVIHFAMDDYATKQPVAAHFVMNLPSDLKGTDLERFWIKEGAHVKLACNDVGDGKMNVVSYDDIGIS